VFRKDYYATIHKQRANCSANFDAGASQKSEYSPTRKPKISSDRSPGKDYEISATCRQPNEVRSDRNGSAACHLRENLNNEHTDGEDKNENCKWHD